MCGLVGTLLHPRPRSPEAWQTLRETTTTNLQANEERGREAAGLAVIQRDGSYQIFKQPVTASALITMEGYRETLERVNEETVCILGHTRMPTKGSRWRNVNNHPLLAGHVVGIHNGVISNDDELFAALGLCRCGEVDSEVIFRLQDSVDPQQENGHYLPLVGERMRLLGGRFATLSIDLRRPTRLLALKHLQPLCIHYERPLAALFFSSRYIFLRRAFGRSVITEALESGHGFYFDALDFPTREGAPVSTFEIFPQQSKERTS